MSFKLGANIKAGHQIKTAAGWQVVLEVTPQGAVTADRLILFGETIFGWKA